MRSAKCRSPNLDVLLVGYEKLGWDFCALSATVTEQQLRPIEWNYRKAWTHSVLSDQKTHSVLSDQKVISITQQSTLTSVTSSETLFASMTVVFAAAGILQRGLELA